MVVVSDLFSLVHRTSHSLIANDVKILRHIGSDVGQDIQYLQSWLGMVIGVVRLIADDVDLLPVEGVHVVVFALRGQRLKAHHPIVLPIFEKAPGFFLGEPFGGFDLLDERELSVVVKIVPWKGEMFIEGTPPLDLYVVAVRVYS